MTQTANLIQKHEQILRDAVNALHERTFYSPYPEHPRAYAEEADAQGRTAFANQMNNEFKELGIDAQNWIGEEVSPYMQTGIGVSYPQLSSTELINRANAAKSWGHIPVAERAAILIESLERVANRYFEIAYATMHTTGQSFMMAFQASGPHANDRALEAIAMGYHELTRFPSEVDWVKPMGKFDLTLHKTWKAVPKGIGLVIGCSTFPTWNTVPGMYASLITGNPVIVKPHPKAILPIAIVIAELRKVLTEQNQNPDIIQLAVDTLSNPITKELAEHPDVTLIDYTGGNAFGDYIESLPKTTFTEKAGVNSVILDSASNLQAVVQNIAFATSLYSGQMCTAPQDVFVPAEGVQTDEGMVSFDEVAKAIADGVAGIANHPKMGAGTLGGIQNDATSKRIADGGNFGGEILENGQAIANAEFEHARVLSPRVIKTDAANKDAYGHECFGPIVFVVKTNNREHSVELAAELARTKGAITCSAYCTDEAMQNHITDVMNNAFTPVSFNFGGAAFVNQHAAFSDFHVTGGNPAGNASFTNPEYINKRFVWVGNRYMS
ncbi:MAG: phenylacetic acid degradation protein PaaN [Flavobacteriales bacterium]|nr:phenylacetic acid degradation protein PaaN [Bacteroidota bacterium]MCB9241861.1 phenylacetic acid degradation protein PaaN [Flavobacteriales bacterium]